MKWIWNPITAWQASSYMTIFQMAWFNSLFPDTYEWFMTLMDGPVHWINGRLTAAWDVLVEVLNTS